jgi:peptide/nickel transport system substrate-binding protein
MHSNWWFDMKVNRRVLLSTATGLAAAAGWPRMAAAQTRAETLRYVTGNTINSLDPAVYGSIRETASIAMQLYDRLFSFGRKRLGENWVFNHTKMRGEFARDYRISPDGLKITIMLRPDVMWHDGMPATVKDVKWSLDRVVLSKPQATPQAFTGSMTSPDQFQVIDNHTIEVTLPKPDRLALANLCVPYVIMINSKVAKQHATADDPWALDWLKTNAAGSGAYMLESYKPGENLILCRNGK